MWTFILWAFTWLPNPFCALIPLFSERQTQRNKNNSGTPAPNSIPTFLDSWQKGFQRRWRYFKLVYHPVAVQQIVSNVLHGHAVPRVSQGEDIKRPIIQMLWKELNENIFRYELITRLWSLSLIAMGTTPKRRPGSDFQNRKQRRKNFLQLVIIYA